ncbi:MAG: prolyl oligopeptidase family serine peptidase [Fibrobacteres bacterium]|nr:prolyl oligopeptidase family serine peptidase [Fibrobacterota bacterium]
MVFMKRLALFLALYTLYFSCSNDKPTDMGADTVVTIPHTYSVISTSTIAKDGKTYIEERIRILRPDSVKTYAQFVKVSGNDSAAVVVVTMPYAGIDWTGDSLDLRWAGYTTSPDGLYKDVDGVLYGDSGTIVYDKTDLNKVIDLINIHLVNNFSVLLIYGRFYAGGDVLDDIADMKAGMWYLAEREDVDKSRVAVYGVSWGGFEAVYAAVNADKRALPKALVAIAPPVDFQNFYEHITSRTGSALTFMEPYLRRILSATKGNNFTGLRSADLCSKLPPATLIMHDELDNLVPVSQAKGVVASCGVEALYWPRLTAPATDGVTHGPILDEPISSSAYLYATTYMHLSLIGNRNIPVNEIYNHAALDSHMVAVFRAQKAGRDISYVVPRLKELCDPRVNLFNIGAIPVEQLSGAEAVTRTINRIWNSHFTAAVIKDSLESICR